MRVHAFIFFCAVAVVSCGRCGFQPEAGVKVVVPAMPTTLDWNASDPNSWSNYPVMLATMRGLTSLRPNNGVGSALATSWERELTEDGHERYRFFLRTDVVWSDGKTPLVAEDFVVGWRRAVQGKERGEMSDILGAKEVLDLQDQGASQEKVDEAVKRFAVTAIDEHTFEVTLAQPRSYFLSRMANVYIFFPAPSAELKGKSPEEIRDYFDRPRDGRPLVLGPFRLDSWDRAGERVRLLRNPHTVFAPPLGSGEKYAEVVTLMKSEIGPALYDRGRVDFVFVDSPVALRAAPSELQRRPLLSTYLLALNTQRPPLDRREVRDAIAHALDRDALLKGLLPTARVSNTFLPPELPGASTPEQARALPHYEPTRKPLEGVRPLRLVYRSDESFIPEVAIAERIKVQLSKIGLNVILEPRSDFSSEVARLAPDGYRAHDLYLRRIGADYAHPNTFFTFFERTGNNYTGWEHLDDGALISRFEKLLGKGDASPVEDGGEYAQAEKVLLSEGIALIPLYHPDRYFRARPTLVGLGVDPFNFLSLRELRLKQ